LVWLQAFFQASAQMPTRGIYSDVTLPYLTLRHQFIHLFDNISEGDIKGFVFQHNSEVYKFISAAVDLFD
jgi:hypothetical protein